MTSKIKKGLFCLAGGFCLLFALRLAYGYWNPNAAREAGSLIGSSRSEFEFSKKNYASEKFLAPTEAGQQAYSVDQKYEKVGSMDSKTSAFERDEAKVWAAIDNRHALIQYERSSGLSGRRHIELALGVVPIEFDHLVQDLKQIGELSSIRIDKTDRTSEYKNLIAKKTSIETARDSLLGLKGRAGNVDQSIKLEDKLIELDQSLQELGVSLGEYSQENEFCTVKFTLEETANVAAAIPFLHRVRVALVWTIQYYLILLAWLLAGAILTVIALSLAEKLKWVTINPPKPQPKES